MESIIEQLEYLEKEIEGVDQWTINYNPTHILAMFQNIKQKINQIKKGVKVYGTNV